MPLTLVLDSCTTDLRIALLRDGRVLAALRLDSSRSHSQTLLTAVDELLTLSGFELCALRRLAVSCGPGSFSGLRIGMTSMQGLSQALGCPLFTFVEHDLIAWRFIRRKGQVAVLTDARRGQVYWALYYSDGKTLKRSSHYRVDDPEVMAAALPAEGLLLAGSGVDLYKGKIAENLTGGEFYEGRRALPEPALLLEMPWFSRDAVFSPGERRIGLRAVSRNLEPLYIRPSDAEINRQQRQFSDSVKQTGGADG
ncbi:MAG TPA: tRNA (adenosine(37)-N6)-threonylcarbamoyltransferase complex dimerization subunit type 1 TsaB [Proteobacteria bacterium]|nr:tRNA (adenosine(37)-N6)-threonylcarbamoyltransferase complex dimerization subunit type 1 TsaB [Pseudomonadota bacterium]